VSPIENWTWTPADEKIAKDLRDFLPPRMFDAHAHVYRAADLKSGTANVMSEGPAELTVDLWRRQMEQQVGPSRYAGGLFFPDPIVGPDRVDAVNDFVVDQLTGHPDSRGLIVVHPGYPQEKAARYLANDRIVGFKIYHTFSTIQPTFDAPIGSFLPEWAWQIADARGLVIMLHLVRRLALADPGNQRYIREMCGRHPNARLVLAHAARGFHAPNTAKGLPALAGLRNVWFDASAICESTALTAIVRAFGAPRLLWGTDFPVSQTRGRCVTIGNGFAWLQPDTVLWDRLAPHCTPTLVGLESLRALRQMCEDLGLNRRDLQDICCDNALRLLGMKAGSDV
jgi:glutamate-1-semialdehyde 2,1-aminomutase